MKYIGSFRDINNVLYDVEIVTGHDDSETTEITLSDNPVNITQQSSGLFTPIKARTCTIEIVTTTYYPDMYTPELKGVTVKVFKHEGTGRTIVFDGYNTPNAYNQAYALYLESLQIEAVDKLAVMKDLPYTTIGDNAEIYRAEDILYHLLETAGFDYDFIYAPRSYEIGEEISYTDDDILRSIRLSESNFFDDDEDRTPWSCYAVLEEYCKYFNLTAAIYGNSLYLIDYVYTVADDDAQEYYAFNSSHSRGIQTLADGGKYTITGADYLGGDSNLSYDETYNKIEISANTYPVEDLATDLSETSKLVSVTDEAHLGTGTLKWTSSTYKWWKKNSTEINAQSTEYRTFFRAAIDDNWEHKYYRITNGTEVDSYYDPENPSSLDWNINQKINTRCALVQKYTSYKTIEDGKVIKTPSKLDWDTMITFFNFNDTTPVVCPSDETHKYPSYLSGNDTEQPVLIYHHPESIYYSPVDGTGYIAIDAKLWYQYNVKQDKKDYLIYSSDNNIYNPSPIEKVSAASSEQLSYKSYLDIMMPPLTPHRTNGQTGYGTGWNMLKCKIQIGNKYWNGSAWTTTESTFYIKFNNAPDNGDEEQVQIFKWMSPAYNLDYTSKIGKDCWAIPITPSDKISGRLTFTIYTPSINFGNSYPYPLYWYNMPFCIHMKDFSLEYVYANSTPWYIDTGEKSDDIVYTHTIDENYVQDFDGLDLKINSYYDGLPVSRSYVIHEKLNGNEFLREVHDTVGNQTEVQENNIINRYLNHYNEGKKIFEATVHGPMLPYRKYDLTAIDGNYVLDSYAWDLATTENKIKLIEY